MKINTKIFKAESSNSAFWFRLFGHGIYGKDVLKHGLLFSERSGYAKIYRIRNWLFRFL